MLSGLQNFYVCSEKYYRKCLVLAYSATIFLQPLKAPLHYGKNKLVSFKEQKICILKKSSLVIFAIM
jgi:hypothetical protein